MHQYLLEGTIQQLVNKENDATRIFANLLVVSSRGMWLGKEEQPVIFFLIDFNLLNNVNVLKRNNRRATVSGKCKPKFRW